jgi:hypothetical protein
MRNSLLALTFCGVVVGSATAAIAQWMPGSELIGQSAQVQTDGVANTVYFDAGGAARIVSPGGKTVPATWTAANGTLCLNDGANQECWPYTAPFQANQPISLTSNCQSVSTWTALGTNAPPAPAAGGERG